MQLPLEAGGPVTKLAGHQNILDADRESPRSGDTARAAPGAVAGLDLRTLPPGWRTQLILAGNRSH